MPIKLTFFLFMTHMIYNLEKILFVNELLVLIGFIFFLKYFYRYKETIDRRIYNTILILICYGFLYIVLSLLFLKQGSLYQLFRTTPVIYSIFTFFVGLEISKNIVEKNRMGIFHKFPFIIAIISIVIGGRLSNPAVLPLLFYKKKRFLLLTFISLLLMTAYQGGSTSYLMVAFFILFLIVRNWKLLLGFFKKRIFIILLTLGFFVLLYFIYTATKDFFIYSRTLDEVGLLGSGGDANALWRLMFWLYLTKEKIMNNPIFGIGFGTPIFDTTNPSLAFIKIASPDDPDIAFTLGPHNSFIYIATRLGAVGLFLMLTLYQLVIKGYLQSRLQQNKKVTAFFLSFVLFTIASLFNVVLESPLYAGLFWIVFGILAHQLSIANKYEENEVTIKNNIFEKKPI